MDPEELYVKQDRIGALGHMSNAHERFDYRSHSFDYYPIL